MHAFVFVFVSVFCLFVCFGLLQRPGPCLQVWDLLKEVTIIFTTSTIVWPQVKQQGGNTAPPTTENWIKDLLSMAPPIRTRPSLALSQSL